MFYLTDFYPFASKLLNISDNTVTFKSAANYFQSSLIEDTIAYYGILPEDERTSLPKVLLRRWTLGEILSALATEGLYLRILEKEPDSKQGNFPAFFTVVADKITANSPLIP